MKPSLICCASLGVTLFMISAQRILQPAQSRTQTNLGLIENDYAEYIVLHELSRRLISGNDDWRPIIRLDWEERHGKFVIPRSLMYAPQTARLTCRLAGDEILYAPVTENGIRRLIAAKKRGGFAAACNVSSELITSGNRPSSLTANRPAQTL